MSASVSSLVQLYMLIVSLEPLEWLGLIVGSSSVSASVSVPASLVVSASDASVSLTVPFVKDSSLGRTWGVLVPFLWFEVTGGGGGV